MIVRASPSPGCLARGGHDWKIAVDAQTKLVHFICEHCPIAYTADYRSLTPKERLLARKAMAAILEPEKAK